MERLRVAVQISGRGSNLQALIDSCAEPNYPAEIALVISNIAGALGLERATKASIQTRVIDHRDYYSRRAFDSEMTREIMAGGAELVCLAGFMRMLSDEFVDHWHNRLINIHPSLLPAFKGLDVQTAAIEAGVRFSGCTVHFVRREMDTGPIINQSAVPIHDDDTADALAARILVQEHRIYAEAVRLIAEGRVTIEGERVMIDGAEAPAEALINPTPV